MKTKDSMKILIVSLFSATMIFVSSCLHAQTHKVFDGQKPQICTEVFDKSPSSYRNTDGLKDYPVEDLITLNKCGKEYTPEINVNLEIMDNFVYPVPVLLEKLNQEATDEFRYDLIETLAYVPQFESGAYKYNDQFKKDKNIIISGVSEAVAKMNDEKYKKDAAKKLFLIRKYFEENP